MPPPDITGVLFGATELWAYGAAPGMELIPYFLALLAWVGMALVGILLWPLTALLRRLRKRREPETPVIASEIANPVTPPPTNPPSLP